MKVTPIVPPPFMRLSPAGLSFLGRHEGCRLSMYPDTKGYCTVGYGHLVHRGPKGSDPTAEAPYASGITVDQALTLLKIDAAGAQDAVIALIRHSLQQHEFDALCSFTFNCGAHALEMSTLRARVNSLATPDAIVNAFMLWNEPPEIIGRRRAEAKLYAEGDYGGAVP